MTTSANKTLAALRQLAVLGLPGKRVVPEALGLLERLAGFDFWGLRFMDSRFRLVEGFASPNLPASLIQDFAENFHNREADGSPGVTASTAVLSGQKVILTGRLIDQRKLERTEFWQRVARPVNMGNPAQMPLMLDGKGSSAVLVMGRTLGDPEFSAAAVRSLEAVHPWLCHLLGREDAGPACPGDQFYRTGDAGVLLLDPAGRIESASPGALPLLLWAADTGVSGDSLRHALRGNVGGLLRQLARAVGACLDGQLGPVPSGTSRNRYGTFHLRAYALDGLGSNATKRISLHIERLVPISQRLFSAPRFLTLPNRQRDVALCLVQGYSQSAAARQLGIKPSSVIHSVRALYHQLEIDGRDKLVPTLLAPAE